MTTTQIKTPAAIFRAKDERMGRCLENHPPLQIGDHVIYGGSCSNPLVTNADIYIGFDYSISHPKGSQYPWEESKTTSVYYPITDMSVPKDAAGFKEMIKWLAVQLIAQKIIHLGCIGGHGRTGLVLAALVAYMTEEKDAITYVRKNYCERAVESAGQVAFLHENFGITKVPGAKEAHRATNSRALWNPSTPAPSTKATKPLTDAEVTAAILAKGYGSTFTVLPNRQSPMALIPGPAAIDNAAKHGKMPPTV